MFELSDKTSIKFTAWYIVVDPEAPVHSPSSPPTGSQSNHLTVPLSPLLNYQQVPGGSNSPLKLSPSFRDDSPLPRRRRNVEEDVFPGRFELDALPYDATSMFSAPSMLSIHSHVEAVASRHEDQEVY